MNASISDVKKKNTAYYPLLDLFRGLAAFAVVLEHARNFIWVDYQDILYSNIFNKFIYFISGFGHEFVMVFFVLSGCVVGRIPVDSYIKQKEWKWGSYFFSRLSRLWIVLLPALILTFGLDLLSLWVAPANSFVFNGNGFAHMEPSQVLVNQLKLTYFLGNLAFLQTILVPTFGNGVLWSLASEFWYYVAFPLLFIGGTKIQRGNYFKNGVLILLGILTLIFVGKGIAMDFPIWILGVVAYYFGTSFKLKYDLINWGFFISLFFTCLGLAISRQHLFHNAFSSYIVAVPFAFVVMFSLNMNVPRWLESISRFFSDFSFSLYVIHAPILTLLVAPWLAINADRYQPNAYGWLLLLLVILILYFGGWLFYYLVERHTGKIRLFIKNHFPFKNI